MGLNRYGKKAAHSWLLSFSLFSSSLSLSSSPAFGSSRRLGEKQNSLEGKKDDGEKRDEKWQMRDFLHKLINQETQAGAVWGLLQKAKLFFPPHFTASANHLSPFYMHANTHLHKHMCGITHTWTHAFLHSSLHTLPDGVCWNGIPHCSPPIWLWRSGLADWQRNMSHKITYS